MEVKALACDRPTQRGLPLARLSHADIARAAVQSGIAASISKTTVWRWLSTDAITDNGSSHRGLASVRRLAEWYPNAIQVHTPVHASWLKQIAIYFSVVQRKVLTPNDFTSLAELQERLRQFEMHYAQWAKPFEWKYTRDDLYELLSRSNQAADCEKVA